MDEALCDIVDTGFAQRDAAQQQRLDAQQFVVAHRLQLHRLQIADHDVLCLAHVLRIAGIAHQVDAARPAHLQFGATEYTSPASFLRSILRRVE